MSLEKYIIQKYTNSHLSKYPTPNDAIYDRYIKYMIHRKYGNKIFLSVDEYNQMVKDTITNIQKQVIKNVKDIL